MWQVLQSQPYTEKVDVYSWALIAWQLAADYVPFKGMGKDEFVRKVGGDAFVFFLILFCSHDCVWARQVCKLHDRPMLDRSWPKDFAALLTACWDHDPCRRPPFEAVVKALTAMLQRSGRA